MTVKQCKTIIKKPVVDCVTNSQTRGHGIATKFHSEKGQEKLLYNGFIYTLNARRKDTLYWSYIMQILQESHYLLAHYPQHLIL